MIYSRYYTTAVITASLTDRLQDYMSASFLLLQHSVAANASVILRRKDSSKKKTLLTFILFNMSDLF